MLLYFLLSCLINHISSCNQQIVSGALLFLSQAVSSTMSYPMINRLWGMLLYFFARQSDQSCLIQIDLMTYSKWVTLLFLFARLSLTNHVSSHDQQVVSDTAFISLPGWVLSIVFHDDWQQVSDTALCLCQAVSSIISYLLTNSKWVGLFLCQVVWSIMSHPMTNSEWVTPVFLCQAEPDQLCLIPCSTGSGWHCFISLPGSLINCVSSYDQQRVSDTAFFPYQAVSSITSHDQ